MKTSNHLPNLTGIRMLDGRITDNIECLSISYKRNHIDIYSMSWGPDDDGKTVDGPGTCTKRALREGVRKVSSEGGAFYKFYFEQICVLEQICGLPVYMSVF